MIKEKIRSFVHYGVAAGIVVAAAYLIVNFALPILMPFGIAYILSLIIRPVCNFLCRRTRIPCKIWGIVLICVIVAAIGWTVWFLCSTLAGELANALRKAGELIADPKSPVSRGAKKAMDMVKDIRVGGKEISFDANGVISDAVSAFSRSITAFVGRFVSSTPSFFFFIAVLIIALYYFSCDSSRVKGELRRILPKKAADSLSSWVSVTVRALKRFAKAYLSLLCITFACLSVGFWIIGIDFPILCAFITALVDILPILGVGTVLVPWATVLFFMGRTVQALYMTVLFLLVTALRQFLEPKFVGNAAGVHPLVALFSVYIGYKVSGVAGMLLALVVLNAVCVFLEEKKEKKLSQS